MNNRPQTLAELHRQHARVSLSYGVTMSLAKAGKLKGVGSYKIGTGWLVTNKAKALNSIRKKNHNVI